MSHDIDHFTMGWNYPSNILTGAGRIRDLPAACKALGMGAPLLVTDPGLAALPMVQACVQACQDAGLRTAVVRQIKGNPPGATCSTASPPSAAAATTA